ncbi:hypothetical protein B0A48_00175 [Cryoendolithus antarcticus]|uniref:LDB19 N-terminal domain-containing protein n=1 Tax=Cryoendolithus antarcticus TaxID=1507870 RepID=A0A1V8TU17_9PEZI|nr:hypothetical protein B0A48_00175 [Cryoendolithus antarcticus]
MPINRILGIDFGRRSQQQDITQAQRNRLDDPLKRRQSGTQTVTEIDPPSMEHVRPSIAAITHIKGSSKSRDGRKESKDRSGSRDVRSGPGSPRAMSFQKPVKLAMVVESPPAMFFNVATASSSGYLLSGRLQVTPQSGDVVMDSITMYLEATTSTKKPVEHRCRECATQVSDLYEWNFFQKPKTFKSLNGTQDLPFSHLIPGHLPATTHGQIGSIDYSLHVRARSSDGQETEFRRDLPIGRALMPGNDKNSVRVFPPTNLNLHVTLPSVIHPIGSFPVQCRMTGIVTKRDDTQNRWRLRKLTWRIEEIETVVSPACPKHGAKLGGEGKGMQHEAHRDLGAAEIRNGFKTDFADNMVEGEFEASCNLTNVREGGRAQCDVDSPNGLKISHILVLELVIAEEWASNKKPQSATPTGAARVLRTQFNLCVTERQGMGIAWNDEEPPLYEDVEPGPPLYLPDSPPHYAADLTTMEDYTGDLHELGEDIGELRLE